MKAAVLTRIRFYLSSLLTICLQPPLFILYGVSGLMPRDPNMWLFGCWNGTQFRGNSRHLFLFVRRNCPGIHAVWITKDRNLAGRLRHRGLPAYYAYSGRGIWKTVKAKYLIVTHGIGDVNEYVTKHAILINLGHAIFPIKDMSFSTINSAAKKFFFYLHRPLTYLIKPDYAVTASPFTARATRHHYTIEDARILPLGTPKTDFLLSPQAWDLPQSRVRGYEEFLSAQGKKILFLPTWRNYPGFSIFHFGFDAAALNFLLKDINGFMAFSFHPFTATRRKIPDLDGCRRILYFDHEGDEMNALLEHADLLITDYSALFADFLIYNRPLVFAKFDHEGYIRSNRLCLDYDRDLPGPKADNWPDLLQHIRAVLLDGRDEYRSQRESMRNLIYPQSDGRACERITRFILSLDPRDAAERYLNRGEGLS